MNNLNHEDALEIAIKTGEITSRNPRIKMVGIMPGAEDYEITNVWCAQSINNQTSNIENILIVSSLSEAMFIVER